VKELADMTTDGYGFIDRSTGSIRLRFERRLSRLPEVVWQALTDGELLARWMFRAHFDPRAGGAMAFDYGENGRSEGTVLAWDEATLLDYQWGETPEQPIWRIRFLLSPSDIGTLLVFEHLGPDPEDPKYGAGWHWHLDRLDTLVNGGTPAVVASDEHFDDLLRHYRGAPSPSPEETAAAASTPPSRTTLRRIAPVFVTTDLDRSLRHYERLGFQVEAYDDVDYYGYACRDEIEIHIAKVDHLDCRTTTSCAYLWVDDADALHAEWLAAGVDGRLDPPNQTEYGLNEGAHIDPDGNLIRFGSPALPPRARR
jgi:uncharacterized protein YndB with AHSA1/START domain